MVESLGNLDVGIPAGEAVEVTPTNGLEGDESGR